MTYFDVFDNKCPKCFGLGKTLNPVWYPLWATRSDLKVSYQILKFDEQLGEPSLNVCKECNGTGTVLPDDVKELLEYILS